MLQSVAVSWVPSDQVGVSFFDQRKKEKRMDLMRSGVWSYLVARSLLCSVVLSISEQRKGYFTTFMWVLVKVTVSVYR